MDTSATLTADLVPVLIKEKMLALSEKDLVFYELADKENLPEGNGKTIQFVRYERLSLPSAPAVEGVTPVEQPLTTSTVQAVVDQWIAVVVLTDVAQLTVKHPVLKVAQDRLGHQHDETVDREVQKTLMGSSNVVFGGVAASRSALGAGDVMTTDIIRKVLATLRSLGAMPFMEAKYVGVVDPFVEMDLTKDGTFVQAASYSNLKALLVGEIGDWMGVRWKRSNFIPIIAVLAGANFDGSAQDVGAPQAGETNFAAGTTVLATVTQLDPATGFETFISASTAITNAGTFSARVRILAAAPTGTFNIYVSLEGGAIATQQVQVAHVTGAIDTRTFIKAGVPNGANRFVVTATGAVAPPSPPAAINVHVSYVFGKEAFGVTELAGLQTFLTPSTPSDSDPAVQRRKASWKQIFKAVIKNVDYYRRIETASNFS
jgi:N4-gp56 family major capsid protein